jgi:hypothetical protein
VAQCVAVVAENGCKLPPGFLSSFLPHLSWLERRCHVRCLLPLSLGKYYRHYSEAKNCDGWKCQGLGLNCDAMLVSRLWYENYLFVECAMITQCTLCLLFVCTLKCKG